MSNVEARVRAALTGTFLPLDKLKQLVADADTNAKALEKELTTLQTKLLDPTIDPWFRENGDTYQRSELCKRNLEIARLGLDKLKVLYKTRQLEAPERKARLADAFKVQAEVAVEIEKTFEAVVRTLQQLCQNAAEADCRLALALGRADELPGETPSSTWSLARKKPAPLTFAGKSDAPKVVVQNLDGTELIDTTAPLAAPANVPLGKLSVTNVTNMPVEIYTGGSNPVTSVLRIMPNETIAHVWPVHIARSVVANPALTVRAA